MAAIGLLYAGYNTKYSGRRHWTLMGRKRNTKLESHRQKAEFSQIGLRYAVQFNVHCTYDLVANGPQKQIKSALVAQEA